MSNLSTIELYVNEDGVCYADDDLFEILAKRDRKLLEDLLKKQEKMQRDLTFTDLRKIKDLEHIRDGVWELKFHLRQQVRYLGCLSHDERTFYVLAAFIKKDRKVKEIYTRKAVTRLMYLSTTYTYENQRVSRKI